MRKEWQVHRAVAECPDGQLRWDHTYQLLLRWIMDQSVGQAPTRLTSQENEHEDRPLRPSIDQSSSAESKH